jgi:ribosomal protein S18 acetylase RimI-like enzyme
MTPAEYESWRSASISNYAEENIVSGRWSREEAESSSEREFADLLPDGLATRGSFLYSIVDERSTDRVGMIWYAVRRESGRDYVFIYDFQIFASYRRKGYGTEAILHLDGVVGAMGLSQISLHVFAHNGAARDLYGKVGYEEKDIIMSKQLPKLPT